MSFIYQLSQDVNSSQSFALGLRHIDALPRLVPSLREGRYEVIATRLG